MSYDRMCQAETKLEKEVEALLQEAQTVDAEEDAKYEKGRRADEIPGELARRESRLAKIKEAKAALEVAAKEKAEAKAREAREKLAERERKEQETGKRVGGRPPCVPDPEEAAPEPKAQRNFTDPESRIMKDGASKSFEQAYNARSRCRFRGASHRGGFDYAREQRQEAADPDAGEGRSSNRENA